MDPNKLEFISSVEFFYNYEKGQGFSVFWEGQTTDLHKKRTLCTQIEFLHFLGLVAFSRYVNTREALLKLPNATYLGYYNMCQQYTLYKQSKVATYLACHKRAHTWTQKVKQISALVHIYNKLAAQSYFSEDGKNPFPELDPVLQAPVLINYSTTAITIGINC